jgi:hypothetical protein
VPAAAAWPTFCTQITLALCTPIWQFKTRNPVSYRIVAQVRDVIRGVPETEQHKSIDQYEW